MDNVAMNPMVNTIAQMAGMQALPGGVSATGVTGLGGNFLAMLLGQMMMPGAQGQDMGAMLLGQSQAEEDDRESGNLMAMQMMAENLAMNGMNLDWMNQQGDAQQVLEQLGAISDQLGTIAKAMQQGQQPAVQEAAGAQAQESLSAKELAQRGEDPVMQAITASGQGGGEAEEAALLEGQGQFRNSILEAQKMLDQKQEKPGEKKDSIDVDKLQNDVDNGRFEAVSSAKVKGASLPKAADVVEQVRTGIEKNLEAGKNEFVIKLKPEGLGEITVKMAENAGKIALSIMTSSAQTARLLNNEMAGLQASLKNLNAEVRDITPAPQNSGSAMSQFFAQDFSGQAQQQQFGFWEQPQQTYYPQYGEEEAAAAEAIPAAAGDLSGLDTYI